MTMATQSRTEQARELVESAVKAYGRTKLGLDDAKFTGDLVRAVNLLADEIDDLKQHSIKLP